MSSDSESDTERQVAAERSEIVAKYDKGWLKDSEHILSWEDPSYDEAAKIDRYGFIQYSEPGDGVPSLFDRSSLPVVCTPFALLTDPLSGSCLANYGGWAYCTHHEAEVSTTSTSSGQQQSKKVLVLAVVATGRCRLPGAGADEGGKSPPADTLPMSTSSPN
ncbi:USP6 N-terminal protein-like [Tropilaelaps mercedesae]|uniref:USP6 N-terminal protein-like n=1 Tax=Tropilaelaps mercedesae TaxID=418985 RepID=A0A1V9XP66_9ACAR|nr:USP6 N-terminal protein-like [Tropilaelaps mercedesae]